MSKAKTLTSILVCILTFFITFLLIVTSVLKETLFSADFYKKTVIDDEYIDTLYTSIEEDVATAIMVLEVDAGSIMDTVDRAELRRLSNKVMDGIANFIIYRVDYEPVRFQNEALKAAIRADLEEYASAHSLDLRIDDETVDDIYGSLTDKISGNINFLSTTVLKQVPSFNKLILVSGVFPELLFLDILAVIAVVFLYRKRVYRGVYRAVTPVWIASVMVWIPVLWMKLNDIPAGIALGESPLRSFVTSVLYQVIDTAMMISGVIFLVATVLILISGSILVHKHIKRYSRRHNL